MKAKHTIFSLAVTLLLFGAGRGDAAPFVPLTVEEMARSARFVVEGQVVSVESQWNSSHTHINRILDPVSKIGFFIVLSREGCASFSC